MEYGSGMLTKLIRDQGYTVVILEQEGCKIKSEDRMP